MEIHKFYCYFHLLIWSLQQCMRVAQCKRMVPLRTDASDLLAFGRRINRMNVERNYDGTDIWVVPASCPHIYRFILVYWKLKVVWIIQGKMWDLFFWKKKKFLGIFFKLPKTLHLEVALCAKVNLNPHGHLLRSDWYRRKRNTNTCSISNFHGNIQALCLLMLLKKWRISCISRCFYSGWLCLSRSKMDLKNTAFLGMFSVRKKMYFLS